MGMLYEHVLDGSKVFTCAECGIDLTTVNELVSTNFRGRTGSAWLFSKVYNVTEGGFEERMMTTGEHSIVEIHCNRCGCNLGWKYIEASNESQKYKQGKYILEKVFFVYFVRESSALQKLFKGYDEDEENTSSED